MIDYLNQIQTKVLKSGKEIKFTWQYGGTLCEGQELTESEKDEFTEYILMNSK